MRICYCREMIRTQQCEWLITAVVCSKVKALMAKGVDVKIKYIKLKRNLVQLHFKSEIALHQLISHSSVNSCQ